MNAELYPDGVGFVAGSRTSRAAADSMEQAAKTLAAKAFLAIDDAGPAGLTADEVAARLDMANPFSARPRIAELRNQGRILDSGRTRLNASGRSATVWIAPRHALLQPMGALHG